MDCLSVSGEEAKMLKRIGSAFLISESGDFLTAAHVVAEMQKSDGSCPTPAITLAAGDWRPEARTEQMFWFPLRTEECQIDSAVDVAVLRSGGSSRLSSRTRIVWTIS
jgi:hypothetical protein